MNDFWQFFSPVRRAFLHLPRVSLAILLLCLVGSEQHGHAQQLVIEGEPFKFEGGRPSPEQIKRIRELRGRGRRFPSSQPEKKKEEKKPEQKKEGKKEDKGKKKEESIKTIKRSTDGSAKLDPNRVRLTPDANGLVQFNYNGQPWADVLQEFADAAKLSFDWQELPADSLNLVTQKKYTLLEARDLLNRHLLARGFTLVVQGEVLTAVKIDKLDPSLVPRVEADELEDYPPHDFVRVRFQLPKSMDPNKVKEDVKVLLSPQAKITPLLNTKRLLVIDVVANLRSVRDLIYAEQSAADAIIKPEVRQIKHRRADYIADQVMIVLGKDPAARKTPQEMQIEKQRLQLFMQMQQKGKDVSKMIKPDGLPVHIAVDRAQNRLFINAPSELLPMIDRTIAQFDVPAAGSEIAGDPGQRTMRRHKTTSSPDAVVTALIDMGTLGPLTQLQSDTKSKTIFAFANAEDHVKIEQLIGKLDGSGRGIKVIWLRRLPAQQVAGTINALLVGEKKEEDNSRRSRYSFFGGFNQEQEQKSVGFKALADVEKNRLLLWASVDEIAEVEKLLRELGELPAGQSRNPSKVRVLGKRSPAEAARLLERLKAAYPGQLNIDGPALKPADDHMESQDAVDKVTRRSNQAGLGARRFRMVQLVTPVAGQKSPALPDSAHAAPAVNVVVGDDGQIVISSEDPAALDRLEDLLSVLDPPQQEYEVFELKYNSAYTVVTKLEEYFADELKDQTESVYDQWDNYQGKKKKELGASTLGRRPLLRFVYDDLYTNTVIVQNASVSQLAVVKKLIKIYDKAPEQEDYYARKTDVIQLKYSRARDIANSLKEVYRELLSSKDKEFQDKEGNTQISGRKRNYVFGEVRKNHEGEESPVIIAFDGVLSIGVDQVSNTLIVSAREEVLVDIKKTVMLLDQAAIPKTEIRVHRVRGILPANQLQQMLKGSLSSPWPGGKPQQPAAQSRGNSQSSERRSQQSDQGDRRRRRRSE